MRPSRKIPLTWFAIYADAECQNIEMLLNQLCDDPIIQMHRLEIRQNEDAREFYEEPFLSYQRIVYFTPLNDAIRIEDQVLLSKRIKVLLEENRIPCEIVSMFEHLL